MIKLPPAHLGSDFFSFRREKMSTDTVLGAAWLKKAIHLVLVGGAGTGSLLRMKSRSTGYLRSHATVTIPICRTGDVDATHHD
jgi:hypothetical protein